MKNKVRRPLMVAVDFSEVPEPVVLVERDGSTVEAYCPLFDLYAVRITAEEALQDLFTSFTSMISAAVREEEITFHTEAEVRAAIEGFRSRNSVFHLRYFPFSITEDEMEVRVRMTILTAKSVDSGRASSNGESEETIVVQ